MRPNRSTGRRAPPFPAHERIPGGGFAETVETLGDTNPAPLEATAAATHIGNEDDADLPPPRWQLVAGPLVVAIAGFAVWLASAWRVL